MEERYHAVMETLNKLTRREEEKRDIGKIVTCVLIVLAVLAAIGGAAYAIYRLMSKDDLDDFEDDFEDDFDDEFFEDEEEIAADESGDLSLGEEKKDVEE